MIFVAISATFYASLGALAAGARHDVRRGPRRLPAAQPAARPVPRPNRSAAANQASIDAFHLAMFVGAGLLVIGAAVSWYGLRDRESARRADATGAAEATDSPPAAAT